MTHPIGKGRVMRDISPKDNARMRECDRQMGWCKNRIEIFELKIKQVRREHVIWHNKKEAIKKGGDE